MTHVLNHSNHHQVYTNFKFIGKCNYIKLPPQYLWDNTSLPNNSLLFLALQSLADGKPLPQLLSVFSVLRLTYQIPYTCKSLFMLSCLCCFHVVFQASEGSQDTYFLWGGVDLWMDVVQTHQIPLRMNVDCPEAQSYQPHS